MPLETGPSQTFSATNIFSRGRSRLLHTVDAGPGGEAGWAAAKGYPWNIRPHGGGALRHAESHSPMEPQAPGPRPGPSPPVIPPSDARQAALVARGWLPTRRKLPATRCRAAVVRLVGNNTFCGITDVKPHRKASGSMSRT